MTVNALVTTSVIFAGISVILQTTSFIIPGWLIIEAKDFSINMALWYVTFCERLMRNLTEPLETCEHFSYNGFVNKRNDASILHLHHEFRSHVGTQFQVTSCWVLATAAFLLVIAQKRTFQGQTPGQPTIYQDEPRGTCNLRAKFLYSGGFAAIFQMFSGVLLSLVIIDFAKRYFALGEPRPTIPHTLFIAGSAVAFSALCSVCELYIVFRTRNARNERQRHDSNDMRQKIPMALFHGKGQGNSHDPEVRHSSFDQGEYMGDYFGLEYSGEDPALMYRTQGTKKADKPNHPFPGYKLAKQNLKGHDREWWSKVTYASMPYI